MLGRFNLFWIGAGGFLTLFCVNEIIAYHQSLVPMWLGGTLSYVGMVIGAFLGLTVMAFLGVEPVRGDSGPAPAPPGVDDEEEGDEDEDESADKADAVAR